MWKLSVYDGVATVVPGTLALALLWQRVPGQPVVRLTATPESIQFLSFVVAAFVIGHFCQVAGHYLRPLLWPGGFPTDWHFTQPSQASASVIQTVTAAAGQPHPRDLSEWRGAIKTVQSKVTANRPENRLDTLYAYCRMFQNLMVAGGGLLILFIVQGNSLVYLMASIAALSFLGMRIYAQHYARELFAAAKTMQSDVKASQEVSVADKPRQVSLSAEPEGDAATEFPFDDGLLVTPRLRVVA